MLEHLVTNPLSHYKFRSAFYFLARMFLAASLLAIMSLYCFLFVWISVSMPIGAALAWLAVPMIVLLWAFPDVEPAISKLIVPLIYCYISSEIVVPNFYAIPVAGVGWVNLRKIINLSLFALVVFTYATSKQARVQAVEVLKSSKIVVGGAGLFLIAMLSSVPLSSNVSASIGYLPQVFTTWYVVLAAIICVPNMRLHVRGILQWLIINLIALSIICFVEATLHRRVMFDIMPASMIQGLLSNPSFRLLYLSQDIRSGSFRAVASFSSALSTGQCGAIILPITILFAFDFVGRKNRLIGSFGIAAAVIVLLTANARGAMLAAIVAGLAYSTNFFFRSVRKDSNSLVPYIAGLVAMSVLPAFAATNKFRYAVFGGGATESSNDGRSEQWHLAVPHILQRPVLGNGVGTSGDVVGFNPGGYVTIDSGLLSVVVDTGLPGIIVFLLMFCYPVFFVLKHWAEQPERHIIFALSLSLIAFVVNTIVLSQTENFGLVFLILGLYAVLVTPVQDEIRPVLSTSQGAAFVS